jgi:hypothetical protein
MKTLSGLQNLYHETVNWSIRYFYRFFISHAFQQLEESCQQKYFEDVKKSVSIDSIFDIIMGCDELSSSLLKIRNNELHETVQRVMTELAKSCEDYLLNSFDLVVSNMGTATNLFDPAKLILVNDVLPTFVHRLSPNVVIKTFISLNKLFLNPSVEAHKLFALFRRLHTLIDQHILHQASLMTSANNWALLSVEEQKRIINSEPLFCVASNFQITFLQVEYLSIFRKQKQPIHDSQVASDRRPPMSIKYPLI